MTKHNANPAHEANRVKRLSPYWVEAQGWAVHVLAHSTAKAAEIGSERITAETGEQYGKGHPTTVSVTPRGH